MAGRTGKILACWGEKFPEFFPVHFGRIYNRARRCRPSALVTDVGNDLGYGVNVADLVSWVAGCLDHLERSGAATVVTELPLARLERLTERQFLFFRSLFFPKSQLTFDDLRGRAYALNDSLVALCERRKIPVISVSGAWYGLDPIHLKRSVWREAWPTILSNWRDAEAEGLRLRTSFRRWAYLRTRAGGACDFWLAMPRAATQRCAQRRNDHFTLLNFTARRSPRHRSAL